MPTGLTCDIYDGSDNTFRGFAIKCLSQIGAGWYATNYGEKKLPLDKAPVIEPDTKYHRKELKKAEEGVKHWKNAKEKPESVRKEYEEFYADREVKDQESEKDTTELRERYQRMLDRVNAWEAPESCKGLKKLMTEQLTKSMEFDCGSTRHCYDVEDFKRPTLEEWIQLNLESDEHSVSYHTKEILREIEDAEKANSFLATVYAELDKVEPMK